MMFFRLNFSVTQKKCCHHPAGCVHVPCTALYDVHTLRRVIPLLETSPSLPGYTLRRESTDCTTPRNHSPFSFSLSLAQHAPRVFPMDAMHAACDTWDMGIFKLQYERREFLHQRRRKETLSWPCAWFSVPCFTTLRSSTAYIAFYSFHSLITVVYLCRQPGIAFIYHI